MINKTSLFLALGTALILSLSFFLKGGSFLAYLALLPLLFLLNRETRKGAIIYPFFGGGLFFTILFYWIGIPVLDYAGPYRIPALFGLLVIFFYLGAFFSLFGLLAHYFLLRRGTILLQIPMSWTLVEMLRTLLFSPLPLGVLGHTQAGVPFLIQTAAIYGSPGLSFMVAFMNTFLFLLLTKGLKRRDLLIFFLFLTFLLGYGLLSLEREEDELITLGIIQSNIPQEEKWDLAFKERNLERHLEPTKEMAPQVDMVIWPESSIPLDPNRQPREWSSLSQELQSYQTPVLTGILSFEGSSLYNSSFLLLNGEPKKRYNKIWLVPFGEYIPFPTLLSWVNTGFHSITKGEEITFFQYQNLTFSTPICYEILNSSLMRQMAQESDFLINLSNEAWFKDSHGLSLLFQVLIIRAVELRRPIIKVANTGLSGLVNDQGEVLTLLPSLIYEYQIITIPGTERDSLYRKFGNTPLILLFLSILSFSFFFRRSSP